MLKYFKEDGEPIRCFHCESEDIRCEVKHTYANGTASEILFYCSDCEKHLGYHAHNRFDKYFVEDFLNFYD